jgi:hypothetical protein
LREEKHPVGYDYRIQFPRLTEVFGSEGGLAYAADGPEGPAIIIDEGTLADFFPEEDHDHLVTIRL